MVHSLYILNDLRGSKYK